ncbi:MAG: DUF222 domain-containing protein [Candidatus Dormibacteraeota bacterium]|nr:DUF222 domain-containing protein [Candidatus Dormibacteraeota bacterium]
MADEALLGPEMPAELVALSQAVERFCAHPRGQVPGPVLALELPQLRHLIDLLELQFARRADEFDEVKGFDGICENVPFQWIRHQCNMSGAATSRALAVGEQLTALPASTAAMESGRIGYGHLTLLASTARQVRSVHPESFDERPLLVAAKEHSVGRFKFDCDNARHAADAAGFLDEHVEAVEERRFELQACERGFVVNGFLDVVGGATLRAALDPLARRTGKDDLRPYRRRLADAVVELATHVLDAGTLPSHGGLRPHLQVTAALETVMSVRGAPAGHIQFAGAVPAKTVERLSCDAGIGRVLFDSKSQIIDVGRQRRVPSAALRRALIARDQGCTWPGCDRPAAWTNAHHVAHWTRDHGATDPGNLTLVCLRHHWYAARGWLGADAVTRRAMGTRPAAAESASAAGERGGLRGGARPVQTGAAGPG